MPNHHDAIYAALTEFGVEEADQPTGEQLDVILATIAGSARGKARDVPASDPSAILNLVRAIPNVGIDDAPGDSVYINAPNNNIADTIHDTLDAIWPGRVGDVFGNNRLLYWYGD